jgi:hypothetical protein
VSNGCPINVCGQAWTPALENRVASPNPWPAMLTELAPLGAHRLDHHGYERRKLRPRSPSRDALAAFGAAGIFDAAERQIRHYSKVHLLRATADSALSSLLDLHSEAAHTPGVNRGFGTDQFQRFSRAPGDFSHSV